MHETVNTVEPHSIRLWPGDQSAKLVEVANSDSASTRAAAPSGPHAAVT